MNRSIDAKIVKLSQQKTALEAKLIELENLKKGLNLTIDHPEIQDIKAIIDETAQKLGVKPRKIMDVLLGNMKKPRKSTPVVVKYRDTDPHGQNNTWSGRGLPPLWLKRYEAVGRSRDEFLVK